MDEPALIKEAEAIRRRVWGEVTKATPVKIPRARRRS